MAGILDEPHEDRGRTIENLQLECGECRKANATS